MQVRCLASTRYHEDAWEGQELEEEDGKNRHEVSDDVEKDQEPRMEDDNHGESVEGRSTPVVDERLDQARPVSRSTSQSSSGHEPTSNGGTDSSSEDTSTSSSTTSSSAPHTSCIQEAQLSPDGSCIFTSTYARSFTVYPIPPSILSAPHPQPLTPYATFTSPDPNWSFACTPLFDIADPSTTHVLLSRRDRYITLHNALWDINAAHPTNGDAPIDISAPLASYKLISPLTEAVTAPLSLTYTHAGTHFFAGLTNTIALFDLEYQDNPTLRIPTIPSARSKLKGGGVGFKGVVSALSLSPSTTFSRAGMLAAGARTRHVGLYDAGSAGEITTFSLPGTVDGRNVRDESVRAVMGRGVSCVRWSPCAKYLYVAERRSDVLFIYDVRKFSLALGYCGGRQAQTNQKLGFDVWNAGASPYDVEAVSHEVWAGGTDGCIRVWRDPHMKEGGVEADEIAKVGEGDMPVVGTMVHASGSLAVAACGRLDVGDEMEGTGGMRRGGGRMPSFKERGSLDILGLT